MKTLNLKSPNVKSKDQISLQRGTGTRAILLATARKIFARDGFYAASTRAISDEAKTNQALISYHFGNKQGLYLAVFDDIVLDMREKMEPSFKQMHNAILQYENQDAESYFEVLLTFVGNFLDHLTKESTNDIARLILMEQQSPTAAFDIIYEGFMSPMINGVLEVAKKIRAKTEQDDLKLFTLTIVCQIIGLRAGRTALCRFMGWSNIRAEEANQIKLQVRHNLRTLLFEGGA